MGTGLEAILEVILDDHACFLEGFRVLIVTGSNSWGSLKFDIKNMFRNKILGHGTYNN